MRSRSSKIVATVVGALALAIAPLAAWAGSESGTTPTCTSGARPLVRGEHTSLSSNLRVDMPSGTIRYNGATRYNYSYQSTNLTRASWHASSNTLKDSGTYGICSPTG